MGRQTVTITSSSLMCNVWRQPGSDAPASEALDAEEPLSDHTQAAPLTTTDLVNPQALVPAKSSDGSTITAEEESTYDMCTEYTDFQDDDYVLVALEPAPEPPHALSGSTDKGQGTSNK